MSCPVLNDDRNEQDAGVRLVCGAAAGTNTPDSNHEAPIAQLLKRRGWHRWHGRLLPTRRQNRDVSLRVCPSCLATPRVGAATIRKRHGLIHMVDWLKGKAATP
jgi:hypothetical protein